MFAWRVYVIQRCIYNSNNNLCVCKLCCVMLGTCVPIYHSHTVYVCTYTCPHISPQPSDTNSNVGPMFRCRCYDASTQIPMGDLNIYRVTNARHITRPLECEHPVFARTAHDNTLYVLLIPPAPWCQTYIIAEWQSSYFSGVSTTVLLTTSLVVNSW